MTTSVAIPMPMSPRDERHMPVLSTLDPSFSPSSLHLQPFTNPTGSPALRPSPSLRASPTSSFSSSKSDALGDNTFSPGSPPRGSGAVPMGSRHEKVPYIGPGTAVYVRQPTRAQLVSIQNGCHCSSLPPSLTDAPLQQRENNGLFGSPSRPYYYRDPDEKPVRISRQ